jgi:hypothetical protein
MAIRFSALLVVALLTTSLNCFGQEADDLRGAALSRQEWQQRVEDARRQSQEFVANARTRREDPMTSTQEEMEAAHRALRDPTLQQGDMISTGKGFVVFVGRDEEHGSNDFLPTPFQQPQAPLQQPKAPRAGANQPHK